MVYFRELMSSPVLHILWLSISAGITLLLPGAALLAWLPRGKRDFTHQLARAMGVSMALTALGALITFLTGLHLTAAGLIIIYAGLGIVGLAGGLKKWSSWHFSKLELAGVFLTLLIGIGLVAWRLYQARSLAFPAWVDSVHHVMIVQAILDRGGLPGNLAPYLPVPFYYHYGFHVLTAVFSVFSRLSPDQAVLVFGQILEAAISLAVYRLAFVVYRYRGILGKWSAWPGHARETDYGSLEVQEIPGSIYCGLTAALLVGLVTHMPGYYLTWGRYTLLAGMALLALAIAEVIELVQPFRRPAFGMGDNDPSETAVPAERSLGKEKSWLVLALLVSGVLLTHYLVAVVLAFFLVIQGIPFLWKDLRQKHFSFRFWLPFSGSVVLGVLLALPWLVWVISHASLYFSLRLILPASSGGQDYASYLWYLAGPQRNYWLLLFAGLGLLTAWLRPGTRVFAAWSTICLLFCLPLGLRIGPLRPDIMVMMIFLPEVVLAGFLLVLAGEAASHVARIRWLPAVSTGLALTLLCAWGLRETGNIINPVTVFATQADRQAMEWIDQNVPENARFYINTALWQGSTYRGVDGGWWILETTGRQVLLPPVIYEWGAPAYVAQIKSWASQASHITGCTTEFWQLVQSSGVDFIYLRVGMGTLQPAGLESCAGILPVYQAQGVYIYQIQKQD